MDDKRKGAVQIDFMISLGLFLVVFSFVLYGTTSYFINVKDTVDVLALRTEAISLMHLSDLDFVPSGWNGTENISRVGLNTAAKRFRVAVNNSKPFYLNQSLNVTDLASELVRFNLSQLGFQRYDFNSTAIYDGTNASVPFQRNGDNITLSVSIGSLGVAYYTVYIDDDSNFTGSSSAAAGTDTINEIAAAPERLDILQYSKMQRLNMSSYSLVKNLTKARSEFDIRITDTATGAAFLSYGGIAPKGSTVVSVEKYILFQNSTGGIRRGKLTVRTW